MTGPSPPLKTYNSLFAREDFDPYNRHYAPLLAEFLTSNGTPDSDELLFSVVTSATKFPNAFLCVLRDDDGPTYCLVHGVSNYQRVMGQPSKWDDLPFGFVGEVIDGAITTLQFPDIAFDLPSNGAYLNVPGSLERARELLDQNPDYSMLGPFPDGDANIQQCRTRFFIPVPPAYANIFLGQRLPIREEFVKMSERLMESGDNQTCLELVEWLLLSITQQTQDGVDPIVLTKRLNVYIYLIHESLKTTTASCLVIAGIGCHGHLLPGG